MASLLLLLCLFSLLFAAAPRCAAYSPRTLFLVKPDPIVLRDHGGALLTGNLTVKWEHSIKEPKGGHPILPVWPKCSYTAQRKQPFPFRVSRLFSPGVSASPKYPLLTDPNEQSSPSRYGNPAFRLWHEKLGDSVNELIAPITATAASPSDLAGAEVELAPYLLDSFGNGTRIDYGTGHETNFAAFLYCLARLGLITEPDYPAVVLRVFASYLDLMRTLQDTYLLEPAGSHGVWGLDDYHFLPFVFGAAQLIDHKYMKPKSIHNPDILENFSKEYMYLACVMYVKKVKKGPFAEHSPMLDDISAVPNWKKVNSGLLKMYKAEVLEKVPIMQHFLFGSLIKWYGS
uniref:Serine/threonine-protein phosphatase 2A activator n=1 Tax=Aegilops tauschii TaxID=37682 RepID=M8CS38_AEGTA